MILGIYEWQKVEGLFTPGGDPCWRCPSCGGDKHIYGIESLDMGHHECKECKTKLVYPEEKKNDD